MSPFVPGDPGTIIAGVVRGRGKTVTRFRHRARRRSLIVRFRLSQAAWATLLAVVAVAAEGRHPLGAFPICALVWACSVAALFDLRRHVLPDVITVPLLIGGMLMAATGHGFPGPSEAATGAAAGWLVTALTAAVFHRNRPGTIGGGDVKMVAALGAWLGVGSLATAVAVSGGVAAIMTVLTGKRQFAYGPFLATGTFMVLAAYPLSQ